MVSTRSAFALNVAKSSNAGLKIAPPEAPVTGYMFDKGVYFADFGSKSAQYCFVSRERCVAYMLLCEVALGKQAKLIHADYHASRKLAGELHSW